MSPQTATTAAKIAITKKAMICKKKKRMVIILVNSKNIHEGISTSLSKLNIIILYRAGVLPVT